METNLNRRFKTRKELQIANKLKSYGSAKLISKSWNEICEPCRLKCAKLVKDGHQDRILAVLCEPCTKIYEKNLKELVEVEWGKKWGEPI